MDYRGKILLLDLVHSGHAVKYICTGHYNGLLELVPTTNGSEADEYAPIPLDDITVRSHWEDPELIASVKARLRSMIANAKDPKTFAQERKSISQRESLCLNLSKLDSLDGDDPIDLSPPVPKQSPSIRPNYVGKLVFIEFPLDSDVAHQSGEFIIIAQSDDSLYGLKTDSAQVGVHVGRIPFTSGDQSIKILSVVDDDQFIRDFIERLDDMTTDDYHPELCDAAETTSRQLSRLLGDQVNFLIINEIYSHDPSPFDFLPN